MTMREEDQKPSLRISHIVYGRESAGNRVKYLVDPHGKGDEKAVPETVVLKRWRKRRSPGYVFGGSRLSSTFWRAVAAAFPYKADRICTLDMHELEVTIKSAREALRDKYLELPSADCLRAIFAVVGPERLPLFLQRHASPEHQGHSGVPDLFLFATRIETGFPAIARFVEVKKPEEKISADQLAEIDFLNKNGLHAQVLRLIEREQ